MKIGIFGGSFDPIHNEHIKICYQAISDLNLDKLFVVPSYMPPHKKNINLLSPTDRLNMLKLAFSNDSKVEVCDYEISKGDKSYTYQTVEHFASLYKDSDIFLIIGADMLEDYPTWKNPQNILDNATLYVVGRSGFDIARAVNEYYKTFKKPLILSQKTFDCISATMIKTSVKLGLNISQYTDQKVCDYIKENHLYLGGEVEAFLREHSTEKRKVHTLNVVELGKVYAIRLKIDVGKVEKACLMHDIAKYLDYKDYPDFTMPKDVPDSVVHQFLGGYIAKKLGVYDEEIIDAITYHTTGKRDMPTISKVVFLADLLEKDRAFSGVDEIRRQVDLDFEKGFCFAVKELYKFLSLTGESVYYLTKECCDYYNE